MKLPVIPAMLKLNLLLSNLMAVRGSKSDRQSSALGFLTVCITPRVCVCMFQTRVSVCGIFSNDSFYRLCKLLSV